MSGDIIALKQVFKLVLKDNVRLDVAADASFTSDALLSYENYTLTLRDNPKRASVSRTYIFDIADRPFMQIDVHDHATCVLDGSVAEDAFNWNIMRADLYDSAVFSVFKATKSFQAITINASGRSTAVLNNNECNLLDIVAVDTSVVGSVRVKQKATCATKDDAKIAFVVAGPSVLNLDTTLGGTIRVRNSPSSRD